MAAWPGPRSRAPLTRQKAGSGGLDGDEHEGHAGGNRDRDQRGEGEREAPVVAEQVEPFATGQRLRVDVVFGLVERVAGERVHAEGIVG